MTFDSVSFQSSPTESSLSQSESYAVNRDKNPIRTKPSKKETTDEYSKDTQIQNWEDEGGADFDSPRPLHRNSRLSTMSKITAHIHAAESMMEAGHYQAAYDELEAATERFVGYKDKIHRSFEASISKLSTIGGRAAPPHPVALPLVKLRQKLTA